MTDPPFLFSSDFSQLLQTRINHWPTAVIGKSVDSGETISIGDKERRAGLYILGGSGTGKTELIKRLILQDIENGHGVFFLDPHGDAVDELIPRVPDARVKDVISLDVRDREYSFAINLLACRDISDLTEREDAFTVAKNVFKSCGKICLMRNHGCSLLPSRPFAFLLKIRIIRYLSCLCF